MQNYMHDSHGNRCACGEIAVDEGMCQECINETIGIFATEVQKGDSFVYNGIEYMDVEVDHVTGRGRIVFYDDFDVRVEIEPLATVHLI